MVNKCAIENCRHAVRASLLLLPETFTKMELYETITGLSYGGACQWITTTTRKNAFLIIFLSLSLSLSLGDFRMKFGENKGKVKNIVSAGVAAFDKLYADPLRDVAGLQLAGNAERFTVRLKAIQSRKSLCSYFIYLQQDISAPVLQQHISRLPLHVARQIDLKGTLSLSLSSSRDSQPIYRSFHKLSSLTFIFLLNRCNSCTRAASCTRGTAAHCQPL